MKLAYLISTGTELLHGTTPDTNSVFLAEHLQALGIKVVGKSTVGDEKEQIRQAFSAGLASADLVISTGGLGPTFDDLTKQVACEVMDCKLELRADEAERIRAYFALRQRTMPDINLRQAMFPAEGAVLVNGAGTAPGMYLAKNGKLLVLLPGPPREMHPMFEQEVVPLLKRDLGNELPAIFTRTIKTIGLGESQVEERLKSLMQSSSANSVALLAVDGEVHIRLTREEEAGSEHSPELDRLAEHMIDKLGRNVYGCDDDKLISVVAGLLRQRGRTLSTAESCTGGLLGKMITDLPGSSDYYWGGAVTYSNQAKEVLLGVKPHTLQAFGAVSQETAREMAEGMRSKSLSDYALAITGVAGPGGGSPGKPVGLVYIALAHPGGCEVRELRFGLGRDYIRILSAKSALDLLRRNIQFNG